MKRNIVKLVSATIIAASIAVPATSAIFGEYNPDKTVSTNEASTKAISQKNSIIIDNEILEDAETINSKTTDSEDILLFPARKVFEALGYTVEWQNETNTVIVSNLPQYITFSIGTDGYTIARTAPMPLNKAPELIDGVTYVPTSLLSEIMEMNIEIDEDYNLIINTPSEDTSEESSSDETEKSSEELSEESSEKTSDESLEETSENDGAGKTENTEETNKTTEKDSKSDSKEANAEVISIDDESITVNDSERGEVILNLKDDTNIIFENGTKAAKNDIKEASKLYVDYGELMTMSLPPIANPEEIVIFK